MLGGDLLPVRFAIGLLVGVDLLPVRLAIGLLVGGDLLPVRFVVGLLLGGDLPPVRFAVGLLLGGDLLPVRFVVGLLVGGDLLLLRGHPRIQIQFPLGGDLRVIKPLKNAVIERTVKAIRARRFPLRRAHLAAHRSPSRSASALHTYFSGSRHSTPT